MALGSDPERLLLQDLPASIAGVLPSVAFPSLSQNQDLGQFLADLERHLLLESLQRLETEIFGAMLVPGRLHAAVRRGAASQRESDAVPDLFDVPRRADPAFAGRRAADDIDPGDGLSLSVGGERCFSIWLFHRPSPFPNFYPDVIAYAILPGYK